MNPQQPPDPETHSQSAPPLPSIKPSQAPIFYLPTRVERQTLFATVFAPALVLLLTVAVQVLQHHIFVFDQQLMLFLHQYATPALDHLASSLAYLGGLPGFSLMGATLCVAVYSSRAAPHERRRWLVFLFMALVGVVLVGWSMKWLVDRPRPALWPRQLEVYGASFPSGHSLYAATLAYVSVLLCWCTRWRWWMLGVALLWAGLMGLSRVYLGAHFPTDVLGGWALAVVWVSGVYLLLARWIRP